MTKRQKFIIDNFKNIKNEDLAKELKISLSTLYKELKILSLNKKPQKHWSKNEDSLLIKHWSTKTKQEILNIFNDRSYESIKTRANILNLKKVKNFKNHNKLTKLLDESNESYYWIGFIMADGHISKKTIKITLSVNDKKHLTKLIDYLGLDSKLRYNMPHAVGKYQSSGSFSFSVMDAHAVPLMSNKFRIKSNKTLYPPDIHEIIESNNFIPWFCGFFDGDGCVLKKEKNVIGLRIQIHNSWLNILLKITKKLNSLGISSRSYIDTQGYARLVVYKNGLLPLTSIINDYSLPLMDRKLPLLNNLLDEKI